MGVKIKLLVSFLLFITVFSMAAHADTDVLDVIITEYVSEIIAYDQVYGDLGEKPDNLVEAAGELGENNTGTSRTGVELQPIKIYGFVNITNVENTGDATISSINVTFNNTYNITGIDVLSAPTYLSPTNFYVNISVSRTSPGSPNNISIFIPELRANDTVLLNYTVEGTGVGEPLNFTEEYSFWRVLTGRTVNVTLNATNNFVDNVPIYDLVITKTPEGYSDTFGNTAYFNYTNLRGEDAANATILVDGSSRSVIQWNASGGILDQSESRQIIFDATAPVNLSYPDINWSAEDDWGLWLRMGNISADFKINGSVSGLRLIKVESIPNELRFAVSKERINESWYWNASFNITNDAVAPIDYNITEITIWATWYQDFDNPGDVTSWINGSNVTATEYGYLNNVGGTVNATWYLNTPWSQGVSFDNYSLIFNYSLIPIVWADASFIILDNGTQYFKLNESRSEENGYLFIEEIYVLLGGYLMKVTKVLTPLEEATGGQSKNRYMVNITLENIGTQTTPDLVTMFDLVPENYLPRLYVARTAAPGRNMTNNTAILRVTTKSGTVSDIVNSDYVLGYGDTEEIASGPYEGYWGYHIDFVALNATANGDGVYTSSDSDSEVEVAYVIQGNESLSRIENAYLVGIDPVRLEGANPSQSVASRLNIGSKTLEYLVIIVSLVVSVVLLAVGSIYSRRK